MRIVYLGNNWVGLQVLRWLKSQGEELAGLVVPAPEKAKYAQEMLEAAALPPERLFPAAHLREPAVLEAIRALKPELGISVFFGHLLKPEFLELFPRGVINLHPSFLPFNRGSYPNVWSILDGTPAGATLHYIDPGVDTGDILVQRQLPVEAIDTGLSLYRKLEQLCVELFQQAWPEFRAGKLPRRPQPQTGGTSHRSADVNRVDEIDLERSYSARELINLLRARTFPPYRGAYFIDNGRKVYLELKLTYEEAGGEASQG